MTGTVAATDLGVMALIFQAGPVVKFVILILFSLSVTCWGIVLLKTLKFRKMLQASQAFLQIFWQEKRLDAVSASIRDHENGPAAIIFRAGYMELMKVAKDYQKDDEPFSVTRLDIIERAMRRAESSEVSSMERHLNFLATTGSAAPFIGLFGTVWGIMNSFQRIGAMGTANLAVVAPGVSEALIATAIGLAAAIPAVIFYNIFVEKIKRLSHDLEIMILEFINIAERGLRKQAGEKR